LIRSFFQVGQSLFDRLYFLFQICKISFQFSDLLGLGLVPALEGMPTPAAAIPVMVP